MSDSIVPERSDGPRLAADALNIDPTAVGDFSALFLHHNHDSPVSFLPPELLAYIMELATFLPAEGDESSWMFVALADWLPDVPDPKQAVLLSHVCRFWRRVALDTARLWTSVLPEVQRGTGFGFDISLLGRAKGFPLIVCSLAWPREARGPDDAFKILSDPVCSNQLGSRAQHIWYIAPFMALTDMDAPLLESLHAFAPTKDLSKHLPRNAPKLRTLSLHGVMFQGAQLGATILCPFLSQLTRLAIAFHDYSLQGREDIVNVLSIIERAPSLTDLVIRNVYRHDFFLHWSTERAALRDKVNLPLLKRLTLIGDQIIMRSVLDHMRLPDHLELWLEPAVTGLENPGDRERELQMDFVVHYLSQRWCVPSTLIVTHMRLHETRSRTNFVNFQLYRSDGHRLLSLPIRGHCFFAGPSAWLRDIAAALPWDVLEETHLIVGDWMPPDDLLERTLRARRIATLHASSFALVGMAKIMCGTLDDDSGTEPRGWLPELRTLVLVEVCLQELEEFLLAWKGVNPEPQLQRVTIEDCQFDVEALKTLLASWPWNISAEHPSPDVSESILRG